MKRRLPKIHKFKSEREKEPFIIRGKHKADSFEVSLNNKIYRQMNPKLKKIKVGDIIHTEEIPYAYFIYKKKKYGVYDDDAGQCVYTYIDGKAYSGWSFTPAEFAVEEWCEIIDDINMRKKK